MPFLQLADYRIHYELTGAASAPVLVLSNSLGTTAAMWEPQLADYVTRALDPSSAPSYGVPGDV